MTADIYHFRMLKNGLKIYLVIILFSGTYPVFAQAPVFRAGAAVVNITAPLGSGIVGNFGIPPAAMHVHDELQARILLLDDGDTKLVFVVADNVGIAREVFDEAKRLIQSETGIPRDRVMMSATHTHSGVSAGKQGEKRRGWHINDPLDEYQLFISRRMADGVRIALNNAEPARIGWGKCNLPQHVFNRRWLMKEKVVNPFGDMDQVQFNPGATNPNKKEPAGLTDPEVSFLSVQSLSGRPIALLANYSLHYVGGLPKDHISADYFAVFSDRIQELLGADRQDPPFVGMMTNGTSGDVNNVNHFMQTPAKKPYEKMKEVAHDVAEEVFKVYQTQVKYSNWVRLRSAASELKLQVRKATDAQLAYARKVMAKPAEEKPVHPLEKTYAERMIQMHNEWPAEISIVMQTFGVGDLGIAAIPFEVFARSGLELKAKSPFKSAFTVSLANGSYGYLPTPDQHELGGYETWFSTNKVEKNASEKIVGELLRLFGTIK